MPILLSSPGSFQVPVSTSEWRDAGGGLHPVSAAVDGIKAANTKELRDKFHGASQQWIRVDWVAPQNGDYELKLWTYNANRSAPVPASVTVDGASIIPAPDIRQGVGAVAMMVYLLPKVREASPIRFYSGVPAASGIFWFVEIELWAL